MSDPINKAGLLTLMREGYAAFEAVLALLSAEQQCMPGVNGEWAIKDILAHLTVWQERVSLRLEEIIHHTEAHLEPIDTDEKMHAFNAATFTKNRTRPLAEVQADFRAAVQRLDTNVEAMDEKELFEPGRFNWLDGAALWQNIAGNTFEHYAEHAPTIEAWLAEQRIESGAKQDQ